MNRRAEAIIIDGAAKFSDEEENSLNEEERIAVEIGKGYDKPMYKIEKYILKFSDIKELLVDIIGKMN